ncbi:MAG TPA: hypothetical protein VL283_00065 [Candidatus Baltobacteraceae bacterium]|nr:hypothetical protein [Candidatus Baltobacteraceae bacterium]
MKKSALLLAVLALTGAGCFQAGTRITTFEECVAAGNPVMESYPRQCRAGGQTFVEAIAVPPTPPPAEPQPETVTLRKGETKTFESRLEVTLTAIEDSRCKPDVQCVWAGELAAVLSVGLSNSEAAAVELRLGQTTKPKGEAYGYAFELMAITEESATFTVTKT